MTLTNTTFEGLSVALRRIGIDELPVNLKNRISHGRYSAVFLLQCLRAMNVDVLHLPADEMAEPPVLGPRRRRPDLIGNSPRQRKGK